MGTHWFDRLAKARAASSRAGVGEGGGLTRRDALARAGVATLGLSSVGALGGLPAATAAAPRTGTGTRERENIRISACHECRERAHATAIKSFEQDAVQFAKTAITPAAGFATLYYFVQVVGTEVGHYERLQRCGNGVCNPQSYKPGPSATPAEEVETGASICPPGTHDCGKNPATNTNYCCFGTDICCNGTCCIMDVGCACAG